MEAAPIHLCSFISYYPKPAYSEGQFEVEELEIIRHPRLCCWGRFAAVACGFAQDYRILSLSHFLSNAASLMSIRKEVPEPQEDVYVSGWWGERQVGGHH